MNAPIRFARNHPVIAAGLLALFVGTLPLLGCSRTSDGGEVIAAPPPVPPLVSANNHPAVQAEGTLHR